MHLIIVDARNRRGKVDGDEFVSEAEKFADSLGPARFKELNHIPSETLLLCPDGKKSTDEELRKKVIDFIDGQVGVESISFFCHGWQTGISAGFRSRRGIRATDEVKQLARAISKACNGKVVIRLFACLTARGKYWWWKKRSIWTLKDRPKNVENRKIYNDVGWRDGFAMMLCGKLQREGTESVVFANLTSGHTTQNPYRAMIQSRLENIDGTDFEAPCIERRMLRGNAPRWKRWRKELITGTSDERRFFPETWPATNV